MNKNNIINNIIDTCNSPKFITRSHTFGTVQTLSLCIIKPFKAWQEYAQTDYKPRHNQVASNIQQQPAYNHKLITSNSLKPEKSTHEMYWGRTIMTDQTIKINRPDIVLLDKLTKTVYLIDITIPNSHNLTQTQS